MEITRTDINTKEGSYTLENQARSRCKCQREFFADGLKCRSIDRINQATLQTVENKQDRHELVELVMKVKSCFLLAIVVFACAVAFTRDMFPSARSETDKDASLTQTKYSSPIRAYVDDVWIFTVHNTNCAESDAGEARFFLKFYLDAEEWWDEYSSTDYRTWLCKKGDTIRRGYNIRGWDFLQPAWVSLKVELYWFNRGVPQLEDTSSFQIAVTMFVQLQNIQPTSYLAVYLFALFLVWAYIHVTGLEE